MHNLLKNSWKEETQVENLSDNAKDQMEEKERYINVAKLQLER